MNTKTDHTAEIDALLAMYQARKPRYSGQALERRRADFRNVQGINRLSGLPALAEQDFAVAELWLTGQLDDSEYIRLCGALAKPVLAKP